jgi:hypothetical protein
MTNVQRTRTVQLKQRRSLTTTTGGRIDHNEIEMFWWDEEKSAAFLVHFFFGRETAGVTVFATSIDLELVHTNDLQFDQTLISVNMGLFLCLECHTHKR